MLDMLLDLVGVSLGCGVVIALLLLLAPVLSARFSPHLLNHIWSIIAIILLFCWAFRPVFLQAPIQLEIPQTVTEHAYDHDTAIQADWQAAGYPHAMSDAYHDHHTLFYQNEEGEQVAIYDDAIRREVTVGDTTTRTYHWTGIACVAYWVVAALFLTGVLVRYQLFRRRVLRWSTPAGASDQAALEAQMERLGRREHVGLYRCPLIHSPLLMGFQSAVILLPEDLPESALDAALAHELTHLKRADIPYMSFLTLARCLHWFNPMVWLMVRRARQDMELACDYDLLQGQDEQARRVYGQAILAQMTTDRGVSGLTTGFSGSKRSVFARFRAIMDTRARNKKLGVLLMALFLFTAYLCAGLVSCSGEQAEESFSITVSLEEQGDSITVNCYSKEDDIDYNNLPALTMYVDDTDTGTLVLQFPQEVGEEIQIDMEQSFRTRHWSQSDPYTPDQDSIIRLTLTSRAYLPGMGEKAVYTLSWNDGQYQCAFQVNLALRTSLSFTGQTDPDGSLLVHGNLNADLNSITYERLDWFDRTDTQAESGWWDSHWEYGWLEALSAPLAVDAQLLYYYGDKTYSLNPATLKYSILETQDGALLELTMDGQGQVTKVVLRGEIQLDLSAENLDFTGFSGTVYAQGMTGVSYFGHDVLTIDPCDEQGYDQDHTMYTLTVAEDADISEELQFCLSGLSSGRYPPFLALELENGVVLSVREHLALADAVGLYNGTEKDFYASISTYQGAQCYQFDNQWMGVQLSVLPTLHSAEGAFEGHLSYKGKSATFYFDTFPLAAAKYGHVAGESEFYLTDLTGDGVAEFVYIYGYHQSGAGEDTCRVFDLTTMEEYPVLVDLNDIRASIRVDSQRWQDGKIIYQLTGPDGQQVTASCDWPEDHLDQMEEGIAMGHYYSIYFNEGKTGLMLNAAISSATQPELTFLGSVTAQITYSPSQKTFSVNPPYTLEVGEF